MCQRAFQRGSVENSLMSARPKTTRPGRCQTRSCSRGRQPLGESCSRRTPTSSRSRRGGNSKASPSEGFFRAPGYADRTADRGRRTLPGGHDSGRASRPRDSSPLAIAAGFASSWRYPTVTMWEFLHGDRWIMPGKATRGRRDVVVLLRRCLLWPDGSGAASGSLATGSPAYAPGPAGDADTALTDGKGRTNSGGGSPRRLRGERILAGCVKQIKLRDICGLCRN